MLTTLCALALSFGQSAAVKEFEVKEPISYRGLSVFPVVSRIASPKLESRYITLDEGMKKKLIVVKEMSDEAPVQPLVRPRSSQSSTINVRQSAGINAQVSQQSIQSGPDVNRLRLINKSNKILILVAGEMVVGGKQDRIVQKDCLIPPDPKGTPLAVFCVEHGRWDSSFKDFDTKAGGFGGNLANPAVRGTAQAKADQSAVWSSVEKSNSKLGTANATGTLREAMVSKKVQTDVSGYVKEIESKMPADACGAIVAIGGKLVWVDVFPAVPDLFGKYWPKLLRSYALDAISSSTQPKDQKMQPLTIKRAEEFLADREGKATFEGQEKVYKLRRTESSENVIYDLLDLGPKPDALLHTCKMLKK